MYSSEKLNYCFTKATLSALLLLTYLLIFVGCQSNEQSLSEPDKEWIKRQIRAQIDNIAKGAEQLDVDAAMVAYAITPNFLIINPDASFSNRNGMKIANLEAFEQIKSLAFTTIDDEFRFITNTKVLYTWFGQNKIQLKTGEKIRYESYVGTMLFSLIDAEWKIVYAHESASTPIVNE